MVLRKLNDNGVAVLLQHLATLESAPDTALPAGLLTENATSEALSVQIEVEPKAFPSRMAAAEYIFGILGVPEAVGLDRQPKVWAWLAAFYVDQLCPKRKDGTRRPGEQARWIPSGHAFRYYRHLLAGPYLIYRAFRDQPERARIVLCGSVDAPGDFVEQLASRQDFVQNKAVIGAATTLYINETTGKPKRGAAPTQRKAGTLRRFVDVINQLDPTWDLYSIGVDELIHKLPGEFNVYLEPQEAA